MAIEHAATAQVPSRWPYRRGLALAWTALVVALCLIPSLWLRGAEPVHDHPHYIPHLDKFVHAAMFAGFGLLWTRAGAAPRRRASILAIGVMLAILTEVLQGLPFVRRDPDVFDGLADVAGTVLGVVMVWPLNPLSRPDDHS